MSDLTMWKTVGANEKNIIQPMSAEGIKQLRDLLTYRNDVRGPGLAYFSPERALALIAAYDAAEARAEKAETERKKDLAHCKYEFERAESAEDRVKARNKHIHTLMCEALENERNFDGMKSQWQTSEAEVARLTKERDWLAERCSELCENDEMYSDPHDTRIVFWKEAARKAVEGK